MERGEREEWKVEEEERGVVVSLVVRFKYLLALQRDFRPHKQEVLYSVSDTFKVRMSLLNLTLYLLALELPSYMSRGTAVSTSSTVTKGRGELGIRDDSSQHIHVQTCSTKAIRYIL